MRISATKNQHEQATAIVEYLLLVGFVVGIALAVGVQRERFATDTATMMANAMGGGSEASGGYEGAEKCHVPQSGAYTCEPTTCFYPEGMANYRCEYCSSTPAGTACMSCDYNPISTTLSCGDPRSGD